MGVAQEGDNGGPVSFRKLTLQQLEPVGEEFVVEDAAYTPVGVISQFGRHPDEKGGNDAFGPVEKALGDNDNDTCEQARESGQEKGGVHNLVYHAFGGLDRGTGKVGQDA
ncbi:uncharacterized protein PG986_006407 [Apiospora aurea]|uniref:Uncharacterized protein n=1 Tax=Apiospora aurea TaxID=335848 RepID=A0ABR1QKC1_9PEZI